MGSSDWRNLVTDCQAEHWPHLMTIVGNEGLLVGVVLLRSPESPSHALHLRPQRVGVPQALLRQLPVALRRSLQHRSRQYQATIPRLLPHRPVMAGCAGCQLLLKADCLAAWSARHAHTGCLAVRSLATMKGQGDRRRVHVIKTWDCSSSPRVVWTLVCAARSSRPSRDTFVLWNTRVASKPIRRTRAIKGDSFPSCLAYLLLFLQNVFPGDKGQYHQASPGHQQPGNYIVVRALRVSEDIQRCRVCPLWRYIRC